MFECTHPYTKTGSQIVYKLDGTPGRMSWVRCLECIMYVRYVDWVSL